MRRWRWLASLVILLGLMSVVACTQAAGLPQATPSPSPGPEETGPPILSEARAVEVATRSASFSAPEVTGGKGIRNPRARLMALEEYEDRFTSGRSYRDRSIPVWVVSMEGEWRDDGIVPPDKRRTYNYAVEVLDARTGQAFSGSRRVERVNLDEAQGLDPDAFARYPLEVSFSYAADAVDFPVAEPGYLPDGFSMERVTLELAHPLQEALPYSWLPNQSVILHYSDGRGHSLQVAESRVGQPDLLPGAEPLTIHGREAWRGRTPDGATWLGWTAIYPEPEREVVYVTYVLHSPDGFLPVDVLQQVAESLPKSEPPGSTPTPVKRPTEAVTPTATSTPRPRGLLSFTCSPQVGEVPCAAGVEVGEPYPYALYTHCGIRWAYFNGRWWEASPPLDDGSGNPPRGLGNPFDTGTMELVNGGLARFTSKAGHMAEFKPLAVEIQEFPGRLCS